MLNGAAVCSIHAYTYKLIGQAVAWKYLSLTDGVKWIKSRSTILIFLSSSCSCAYICVVVVSKTIPKITMKPTDQNGLSLSLSSLLTPIVPLLSLSLSPSLLSAFFYYRMYAKSFSTITPTNKRVMWEKDGQKNKNRYYFLYLSLFFSFTYTFYDNLYV